VQLLPGGALLEREQELATLHEGLDRARAGDGSLFLIEGPAGAGKTVLAGAARQAAETAGMTVLAARGSELEESFAFGVVRQVLEPVFRAGLTDADLFAGAAGPAARLFDPAGQRPLAAEVGFEALHSLYWLVANIADRSPILMLVDDCQWADRESLRFIAYLAQRVDGIPVAVILTKRSSMLSGDETDSMWQLVASGPAAVTVYPRPLSESAVAALTRERLGAQAAEEFCRACHAATSGNPLFLRELLRALGAAGVMPTAAAASEVEAVGPAAVSRFVLHRLALLGAAPTELARTVAVLGQDSELALGSRVSGLTENAARAAADDLVRADIFVSADRLAFVHPIVRAALYEDLAPGERQARHAAAAEALDTADASAEQITAHLLLTAPTGDQRRVSTLRSAAASAVHRGAPEAAAACLRRALAESPAEQERAEILADLGWYEVATMQFEAAEEHLRAVLASGATLATRADAGSSLARCAIVSGGRSARSTAEAVIPLATQLWPIDPDRALQLHAELLVAETAVSHLRPGLPAHLGRFRELARGRPAFEAVARIVDAHDQLMRGEPAAAATNDVQAALMAGLPRSVETTTGLVALFALVSGERYQLAALVVDAALARARREGHATRQGILHGVRAAIALGQGSLQDAQVEAETGLLLVDTSHFIALLLLSVAITVHIERGSLDAAASLVHIGETIGVAEDRAWLGEFLTARGRLRIAQGQLDEGVADFLWCGQRQDPLGLRWPSPWKAYAAQTLAAQGEKQLAAKLGRDQLAAARRAGTPGALGLSLRSAGLAIGGDDGLRLLREAVTVLENSPARLELAYALTDLGEQLSRSGRRTEGRDTQRRAVHIAGQCGAITLAERALADLHAGPGRRVRTQLTGPGALTAAEWRVCRQVVEGRTNREVAQALFLTEKTIERHLSSAYQKLGIRSRFQLTSAIRQDTGVTD
jgi:DNA-binding CsgD family transcriptional regulator